jgi:dTDP-4-amino-4,6-dideoxygalactose transaminase
VDGLSLPPADLEQAQDVYHMFVIRLADHDRRQSLARHLKEQGIETGIHYPVPNHQQPAVEQRFGRQDALPRTEQYVKRILSLPMYPMLEEPQVRYVADQIKAHLARR